MPAGDSLCQGVEATSYLQLPAKHTCLSLSPIRAAQRGAHRGTMSTAALQTHLEISLSASTTSPIQDPTWRPLDILELSVYLCEAKNWNHFFFFFGKASEWIQKVPCAALDLTVGKEHIHSICLSPHFSYTELSGMKRELSSSIYLLHYV